MRITSLVENTTLDNQFDTEHGLSIYIETSEHKILFDMGQTDLFIQNAVKIGIDIEKIDIAVLSHGHYDHGGGLKYFLDINKKAPVYINRHAFEPHYNGTAKYIALDVSLKENERIYLVGNEVEIDNGIKLCSCNQKEKKYDLGAFGLTKKRGDIFSPDDFKHEQYLLICENKKEVLFSGCSHKGIMDIVRWFTPDVLVGGFHFSKLPFDHKLEEYAAYLSEFPVEYYTCHCTGVQQYVFMKKYMNQLHYLATGQSIEV